MDAETLAHRFEAVRPELTAYLCRLVLRTEVAQELAQTAFVRCAEAAEKVPADAVGTRAWLFRVATNLAIDESRRHRARRETLGVDLRAAAEGDPAFVARSQAMIGTPETKAIAREHLVACFACTLKNLPEHRAAALLLCEVHGFTLAQTAALLEADENRVKNWLQEARAAMRAKYAATCALVAKQGVCHQCIELDGFFRAEQGNPLPGDGDHLDRRLALMRAAAARPWGAWHRLLFNLLDEIDRA